MKVFLIRAVLTILLLVIVWQHAHWSVALCLSLLAASNEITAQVLRWKVNK